MIENGHAMATLDNKIETLRSHFTGQFAGVRSDIKELTQALRELIRLDGDIKRQNDALARIGRQVDSHDERLHEIETVRLPLIETAHAGAKVTVGHSDRMYWLLVTAGASIFTGVVVGLIVYAANH